MRIILIIGFGGLLLFNNCLNQGNNSIVSKTNFENKKKLLVSFTVEDSSIALRDDFVVLLISNRDTLYLRSKNNELILPELDDDTVYSLVFKYKNYNLPFKWISKRMIFSGQDMEWKFGIDWRPFNNLTGLLSYDEYKSDARTKEIQYLQFNFFENGDGIQFVNKIPR